MPDKISILKESGETINSNVVSVFMIPDTEKKYIITTENAVDPHGLTVLHVSEIVDGSLQKIATDEEWSSIKTIMRAMISGNVSSYQYLPTVENIKASGQYSRDISVSASASKQMIDNYMIGDKSNVASVQGDSSMGGQQPGVDVNSVNQPPNQNAIFPTGNTVAPSVDDELIPGISEVNPVSVDPSVLQGTAPIPIAPDNQVQNPVMPVAVPGMDNNMGISPVPPVGMNQPMPVAEPISPMTVGSAPVMPVQPTIAPSNMGMMPGPLGENPVAPIGINDNPVGNTPVMMPGLPDNNLTAGMNNDVQVPVIPVMPPLTDNVNTTTAVNDQVNNSLIPPTPVLVNTDADQGIVPTAPVMPEAPAVSDVQVVQPSVVVPTAQIAQEAQTNVNVPEVKIDTNATPSFAPDASLDEVVVAAQEMFMEGVKNLVQTIQEKVYRDLYARENAVKEKETLLDQREKMLNEQMMAMMSNFAAMQGKSITPFGSNENVEKKQ